MTLALASGMPMCLAAAGGYIAVSCMVGYMYACQHKGTEYEDNPECVEATIDEVEVPVCPFCSHPMPVAWIDENLGVLPPFD